MKLLFDQNISHKVLNHLTGFFANSTSVKNEGLINATDKEIYEFAKKHHYIIITQDSDFNDLNSLYGFPPKIIWIRTGNLRTKTLADLLHEYTEEIKKFNESDDYGCFEIIKMLKK